MLETRIKKANKVIKIVILSIVFLGLAFALTIGGLCLFGGYQVIHVVGDSSMQSIKPFSLILVKPCKVEDLVARDRANGVEMGDFAVTLRGSSYVTHEVCTKYYDEETGEWIFDTIAFGKDERVDVPDSGGDGFKQNVLVGKVVAKESFIGKLVAWIQGYANIESALAPGGANKTLAVVRIATLGVILYAISKFAEFVAYKDDIY